MSPLKRSNNIAARMGRWSANHRKKAIFGWLAFVVALGRDRLRSSGRSRSTRTIQRRRGPSRRPDAARCRLPDRPADRVRARPEQEPRRSRIRRSSAVVKDTIVADAAARAVFTNLQVAARPAHADQVSNDGHTALVEFTMKGTDDQAKKVIDPIVKSTDGVQAKHRDFYVGRGRLDLHRQGARQAVQFAARGRPVSARSR